jgi:hypothetical protein
MIRSFGQKGIAHEANTATHPGLHSCNDQECKESFSSWMQLARDRHQFDHLRTKRRRPMQSALLYKVIFVVAMQLGVTSIGGGSKVEGPYTNGVMVALDLKSGGKAMFTCSR